MYVANTMIRLFIEINIDIPQGQYQDFLRRALI